jgi:hypothetical protein
MIHSMERKGSLSMEASKTLRKFPYSLVSSCDANMLRYRHIRRLTADLNSPMPLIDIAHQHLLTTRALHETQPDKQYDPLDWSALISATRVAAGLDAFDSQKHNKVVRDE